MGIVSSLISLGIVVLGGYITITYIIPRITEGTNIGGEVSGIEGSGNEVGGILDNLKDAVGLPMEGTIDEEIEKGLDTGGTKKSSSKKEKAPYDASKGMAGKGESKKKKSTSKDKKAKEEFLYAYYNFGDF